MFSVFGRNERTLDSASDARADQLLDDLFVLSYFAGLVSCTPAFLS